MNFRFDLPPEEALAFFRDKGLQSTFGWSEMLHEEHDRAFTVAKMADMDLLADMMAAVDRAIADGETLDEFKRKLKPRLQKAGWWGRREMIDPITGELKTVQLGSARRLRTIFNTNLKTSYAAGHWKQTVETADDAPYLMYDAINNERTRPQHRAWDGLVLRWDDPFWLTHYPPNDWECRCGVIQLDEDQLRAMGKSGPDKAPPIKTREWVNKRTGEILNVPEGIGPGWAYHPGRVKPLENVLNVFTEKLEGVPDDLAQGALSSMAQSETFARFFNAPTGKFPMMKAKPSWAKAIGSKRTVAVLSDETLMKNKAEHGELTIDDYKNIPKAPTAARVVAQDTDKSFVVIYEVDRYFWLAVKTTSTGEGLFLSSFRRTNVDDMRRLRNRGKLIDGSWPDDK